MSRGDQYSPVLELQDAYHTHRPRMLYFIYKCDRAVSAGTSLNTLTHYYGVNVSEPIYLHWGMLGGYWGVWST